MQTYANIPTEPEDTTKTIAELNPLRYRGYYYDTDDLGFYYLQSRYYDANICRFISADSVDYIGITGSHLSYNTFAYCENNPVAAKDDGGEFWHIAIGALVGAAVGAISSVVSQTVTQLKEGKSLSEVKINGAEVGIAAGTGALSGALAATGVGAVGQAFGGAGISMLGNAATQVSQKGFKDFDVGDMLLDGAIGGAAGIISGAGCSRFKNGESGFKNMLKMGRATVKRTVRELTHNGLAAYGREAKKAAVYYIKSTAKYTAAQFSKRVLASYGFSVVASAGKALF